MKNKLKKVESPANEKIKKKLEANILPDEYKIIDIVVNGRRIYANVNKMLRIVNAENKSEVIAAMNKLASYYQYFSRVAAKLDDIIVRKDETFDLWLAGKMSDVDDKKASSESAKKRIVMVKHEKEYKKYSEELHDLKYMQVQAKITEKSLDKRISLIQSIGAMIRSDKTESSPTSGQEDY